MKRGRWFLPDTPDVVGLLRRQVSLTMEGLDALVDWAEGDAAAGRRLPEIEHRGDAAKRALLEQLRDAFVLPLAGEDVFALSRGVDWVLDYARDLVSEAEAMNATPDAPIAEMASLLREAMSQIDEGIAQLDSDPDGATAAAEAAIRAERQLERTYYKGMGGLLEVEQRHERISLRELYRGCARIGETIIEIAERIFYAVVKRS